MTDQPVIVDVFVSVDGWAGSDNLPGYFGYSGPQLEERINAELARPQLYLVGRRTYQMLAGLPAEVLDEASRCWLHDVEFAQRSPVAIRG